MAGDLVTTSQDAAPAWAVGRGADVAAFLWGFAEATVFFIVPDVLLTLTAPFSWKAAARQTGLTLAGAVLGGLLMFTWASREPGGAAKMVRRVPFVTERMMTDVRGEVDRYGVWALCLGPARGVPYKAYAVSLPGHTSAVAFAAVTVPGRAERFVVVVVVAALVGGLVRRWSTRPRRDILIIHAAGWIAFYAYYWGKVSIGVSTGGPL
jgi:membrane protein YqaA with SNARE-associated domain